MSPNEKPLTVSFVSLGCPKNLVDSERMLADLAEAGILVGAPMDDADVVVVNTCGFLSAARYEALEVIAEALEHKRRGRVRRVVVTGCLPTRDGRMLYETAPGIDAVVGVNSRDAVLAAVTGTGRFTRLDSTCPPPDDRGRFRLTPRHTAFLRIAEGCSQRCTYCTIPAIRGPFRSKDPRIVLAEARELIADGAVELNVIAQDTTEYGTDFPSDASAGPKALAGLLRELDAVDGVEWIRLMYTYPRRFDDELIDALTACRHVVPYVDIPLQHIADGVLKRMGRGVTRKRIETLLSALRHRIDAAAIRTTFIVGFPGETDEQFAELLEFVEQFRFDALGVFQFSPEEGTPAVEMLGAIANDVKADRAERIMLAQQRIVFEANEAAIGRSIVVLVDGIDEQNRCIARHCGQAPEIDALCILTAPRSPGEFVRGTIVACDGYDLIVEAATPDKNHRQSPAENRQSPA